MNKIWNVVGKRESGESLVESILGSKGITDSDEIKEFLSNKPQKTYDPFLIKNMAKAVESIKEHLNKENKIVIFGDYDVGATRF